MSDLRWKSVAAEILADMQPKPVTIPSKPVLKLVSPVLGGLVGERPDGTAAPSIKKPRSNVIQRPAGRFVDIMTLHELLAWALADFEIVLADKKYEINGYKLCDPDADGARIVVGFAGSVLAVNANDPTIKTKPFQRRVSAIQSIEVGYFTEAYISIVGQSGGWPWWKSPLLNNLDFNGGQLDIRNNEKMSRREARRCLPEIRKLYRDLKEANL